LLRNPNSKDRLINEPQGRRQLAVANRDRLETLAHLEMMERTAAPERTVPQETLEPMPLRAQPFCHHLTSVRAQLHLATVVLKVSQDHPAKEDHLARLVPMPFSHHLVPLAHLGRPVPMAKVGPKVHLATLVNKRQGSPVQKVRQVPQGPLVNQAQEANPATMENQGLKDLQDLKAIEDQVAIPATQAVPENPATLVTKVYRALVLNAHRLDWLQAISRQSSRCEAT